MRSAAIHRPSEAALAIIARKVHDKAIREALENGSVESVGICQGTVLEIIVASDIAEKTSAVIASELNGSCPQHMTCLVVVGKTSAVTAAIDAITAAFAPH